MAAEASAVGSAIEITGLKKNYGPVEAVLGIDLTINRGEIFGLIGPDGAGKTSVFQILGGVMPASSGDAIMLGQPAREARSYVGYLTQVFSLYHDLSVAENLRYMGELRRLTDEQIDDRGGRYLEMFGMECFKDRLAGRLSGGMKQKLSLACALIIEPKILLLDEPTTGVDPVSRREFWDALADLSHEGITIVVATPYLDEAERCNRVALMHDGLVHQVGTPRELRESLGLKRLVVRAPQLSHALDILQDTPGIEDTQRFGDRLDVMVADAGEGEKLTRETLHAAGIEVQEIGLAPPTLENAFVALLRQGKKEKKVAVFQMMPPSAERKSGSVAIGASHLSKKFGEFVAVKDLSLEVRYGEIYGLLGANGAGKTTTIKMLCGLIEPTSGEGTLAGETGPLRSSSVRRRVGYMSQKFSLYDDLMVEENIDFFAGIYGVPKERRRERKDYVLRMAGIEERRHSMTRLLSGGWKQRLALGCAILHEPPILFLDEPTSGVDPIARRTFWDLIYQLSGAGHTIFVSTHYMDEAEYCHRLALMYRGKVIALGTPAELKQSLSSHYLLRLEVSDILGSMKILEKVEGLHDVAVFGGGLHVTAETGDRAMPLIRSALEQAGITVTALEPIEPSMEDVFVAMIEAEERKAA